MPAGERGTWPLSRISGLLYYAPKLTLVHMALTEEQLADIRSRIPARPETDIPMPYEDLVRKILTEGTLKSDRTGTGTISLFGQQMRFDLSKYFPLLTTKTVFFKGLAYESAVVFEGFLQHQLAAGAQRAYLG